MARSSLIEACRQALSIVNERLNLNKPPPPAPDPKIGKLAPGQINNRTWMWKAPASPVSSSSELKPAAQQQPQSQEQQPGLPSPPKKSWAELLRTPTKPSANGLPTSSVVGFSVPASPPPGALSASSSYPHATRAHLLALLAPSTTAAAAAGATFASSSPPPPLRRVRVRGIVNTGNMCFANAVLQVLVYCEPFWRLFGEHGLGAAGVVRKGADGVRTPLVDATVQFLREFAVEGGAAPVGGEGEKGKGKARAVRERLDVGDEHDEGEAFVPAYVYEAMKEKKRFDTMRVGILSFPSCQASL
jgi:ubiquitin carboxyl-terminal hydrolase 10